MAKRTARLSAQINVLTNRIEILGKTPAELVHLSKRYLLALDEQEMRVIQRYYERLDRNPTDIELETIAQTWSEHCKHKTLTGIIEYHQVTGKRSDVKTYTNLLKSTIFAATKKLAKPWCVSVFEDNAGIIEFDKDDVICFKVETHNHPSAIEPYGGASTGVGGVIRDILGAGLGAKPLMNTDVFCFGLPDHPRSKLPRSVLHPKRIMKGVVSGVRDYGNRMGIPTANGAIVFDERYTYNPLVYCGTVGIMPRGKAFKKVSPGELIVAVGGRTGRDGIHGATFSSLALEEGIESSVVQIGNAIVEKKMMDVILKARDEGLYTALTDCGAGGFSSAVGELGSECGACVELEKAPLKYAGLKPWEIWVSEAQERMVLSVPKKNLSRLLKLCADEDVEATVIGTFTGDKTLSLRYQGTLVGELDMTFLHHGLPKETRRAVWSSPPIRTLAIKEKRSYAEDLKGILGSLNVCSKEWVIRQYDHEVQAGTIVKPLGGVTHDGPQDAAVIRPKFSSWRGIVVSNGINPKFGIDPYWMAASAIDEALRNLTAVGGDVRRAVLLDNFCWGTVRDPRQLGMLTRAAIACHDMSLGFSVPFVSGKDSLNNEYACKGKSLSIPPTLLISAMTIIADVRTAVTSDLKQPGNLLYAVGQTMAEFGGTHFAERMGVADTVVPRVDPARARRTMISLHAAISAGLVAACHDCSEGGLALALAEMAFSGGWGARISTAEVPFRGVRSDYAVLFSESNSRFLVEVAPEARKRFERTMRQMPCACIGEVTDSPQVVVLGRGREAVIDEPIAVLKECWQKPLRW